MISIIIPTYNRQDTIKRSIMSVLQQTYQDFEIIIIDDNSIDDTEKVVGEIKDSRIKYIKHELHLGACGARNTGIKMAMGKYIAFQDSDDEWLRNKLDNQMQELINYDADIVACSYYQHKNGKIHIMPNNKIYDNDIFNKLLYENFIGTPCIFGKRECFLDETFDIELPRFQDWDLMLRISQKYKIHFINEPLINVYMQDNSLSQNHSNAIIALKIIIERNKKALLTNPLAMQQMYKKLGLFSMKTNNYTTNYFAYALKCCNFNIKLLIRYLEFKIRKYLK